ncbi:hypothetical protein CMT76_14270 [Elizabethkingia anophelis]|nr:hypothetical protein [Elizabethkingia anophelis]
MEDNTLFFKEIETILSPEGIAKSKQDFKESFSLYNISIKKEENKEDDIILHFENNDTASWVFNFHQDLAEIFQRIKISMEKAYLNNKLKNFEIYVEKSLMNIQNLDQLRLTTTHIDSLISFFKTKYGISFNTTEGLDTIKNKLKLNEDLSKKDLQELYLLSIDDYIDDRDLALEDFINTLFGVNYKTIQFKCKTNIIAKYIENLLPLFDNAKIKELEEARIFYTAKKNPLTVSNFNKYKSTNQRNNTILNSELQKHFTTLHNKVSSKP